MRAYLSLREVGLFSGRYFGWQGSRSGEVVHFRSPGFSPEVLTDPTYFGKVVIYESETIEDRWPLPEETQSFIPHLSALVLLGQITESDIGAHFTLRNYLASNRICGFVPDNPELLRDALSLSGRTFASIDRDHERASLHSTDPDQAGNFDLKSVSAPQEYIWDLAPGEMPAEKLTLAVWDFGLSYNLLRSLKKLGCRLLIVPPEASAEHITALHPDGVVLAGGPLDEAVMANLSPRVERIVGIRPTLGVGNGAVLLGMTMGIKLRTLETPHYGAAIPVEDHAGKVVPSYQAHSLALDRRSLVKSGAVITHINVKDGTIEGFANHDLAAQGTMFSMTSEPTPSFLQEFVASLSGAEDEK